MEDPDEKLDRVNKKKKNLPKYYFYQTTSVIKHRTYFIISIGSLR